MLDAEQIAHFREEFVDPAPKATPSTPAAPAATPRGKRKAG